ncbi:PfkB family carbohydrate kinase, partial [Mycoplasmoides pneumoniae]
MLNHNSKVWIVNYACAIDYYLDKHKQQRGVLTPGGKGINMAIVMALFGIKPTVLTFLGQPTKDLFLQLLKPYQLDLVSFPATTQTRINVKLLDGAQTTEINDVTPL